MVMFANCCFARQKIYLGFFPLAGKVNNGTVIEASDRQILKQ